MRRARSCSSRELPGSTSEWTQPDPRSLAVLSMGARLIQILQQRGKSRRLHCWASSLPSRQASMAVTGGGGVRHSSDSRVYLHVRLWGPEPVGQIGNGEVFLSYTPAGYAIPILGQPVWALDLWPDGGHRPAADRSDDHGLGRLVGLMPEGGQASFGSRTSATDTVARTSMGDLRDLLLYLSLAAGRRLRKRPPNAHICGSS